MTSPITVFAHLSLPLFPHSDLCLDYSNVSKNSFPPPFKVPISFANFHLVVCMSSDSLVSCVSKLSTLLSTFEQFVVIVHKPGGNEKTVLQKGFCLERVSKRCLRPPVLVTGVKEQI